MRLAKDTIIANDQEYRDDFAFGRSRSLVELATGYTTRARRRPREGPEPRFELLNIRRRMTLFDVADEPLRPVGSGTRGPG